MLIGYVSDERYVAVPGVLFELEGDGASVEVRSRATGSVYADVAPGEYLITLHKSGYGSKRVKLSLPVNELPSRQDGSSMLQFTGYVGGTARVGQANGDPGHS